MAGSKNPISGLNGISTPFTTRRATRSGCRTRTTTTCTRSRSSTFHGAGRCAGYTAYRFRSVITARACMCVCEASTVMTERWQVRPRNMHLAAMLNQTVVQHHEMARHTPLVWMLIRHARCFLQRDHIRPCMGNCDRLEPYIFLIGPLQAGDVVPQSPRDRPGGGGHRLDKVLRRPVRIRHCGRTSVSCGLPGKMQSVRPF